MKSIMMFAAAVVCGLSVLVSGCGEAEKPADAKADTNKTAKVENNTNANTKVEVKAEGGKVEVKKEEKK